MSKLAQLQRRFREAINDTDAVGNLALDVQSGGKLSPNERVKVYRENIRGAMKHALELSYPICQKIVGPDYFSQLTSLYLERYPSHDSDLNAYGEFFPEIVLAVVEERNEAEKLFYLPDVAELEWHWYRAHYATDDEKFDFAAFEQATQECADDIVFLLSHSAALMSSPYPVHQIWQLNRDDGLGSETEFRQEGDKLLIWRENYKPIVEVLDQDDFAILSAIQQRRPLGELCGETLSGKDEVASLIPQMIRRGWIRGFTLPS